MSAYPTASQTVVPLRIAIGITVGEAVGKAHEAGEGDPAADDS